MSVWRRKAIQCAPELKKEFEQPDLNLYTVFIELLPLLRNVPSNPIAGIQAFSGKVV